MRALAHPSLRSDWTSRPGWIRWQIALGLLLLEYLAVSASFDVRQLAERTDWLGPLGSLGSVGPLVFAATTATVLLGGRELREQLAAAALAARGRAHARLWTALPAHGSAFVAFFLLTPALIDAPSGRLALSWAGAGLLALLTLLRLTLPLTALAVVCRRAGPALALGAVVGAGAFAAGVWAERLWAPLAGATLALASGLLRAVGAEVSADPVATTLGVDGFEVVISPVCSGYQGIGLILILMGAYLFVFRRELRFPAVLLLVPLAVGLVWLANSVRIASLMAMGAWGSREVALGGFHSKAGWILFCAIALGLVTVSRRSRLFDRRTREEHGEAPRVSNPTAGYLMPLLALVAAGMLTSLFSSGLDFLYGLPLLAGVLALWIYRGERERVALTWSWSACGLGIATFGLWVALEPAPDPTSLAAFEQGLAALPPVGAALWVACRFAGSVAVVPLLEELAFRGYLLRRLVAADFTRVPLGSFTWLSFLGSSLAFGLLHQRWLAGLLAGMLFALAQYRRGRLGDAIVAHAVANLLIACYVVGWGKWSFWL